MLLTVPNSNDLTNNVNKIPTIRYKISLCKSFMTKNTYNTFK